MNMSKKELEEENELLKEFIRLLSEELPAEIYINIKYSVFTGNSKVCQELKEEL